MPAMLKLGAFLDRLSNPVDEVPIEPDLKTAANKQRDKEIKERQELESGAVLQAVTRQGEGTDSPGEGDLVYVQFSVLSADGDVLHTTWAEEGGSGQPLAFVLGKGQRAPRAWELAVQSMTRNMRKRLRVQPSYGYRHPDCSMPPPRGVDPAQQLQFDLQLVNWYPATQVRVVGDGGDTYKRVLTESHKWEMARPPNEVVFSLELRAPAYDGIQGSGRVLFSNTTTSSSSTTTTTTSSSTSSSGPCRVQLGEGHLPEGLEAALGHMSKGEKALFVLPAQQMAAASPGNGQATHNSSGSGSTQGWALPLPPLPQQAAQVEARLELHDLVQVRDVTGDGRVMKRRLQEGTGEFPVDCPLHDTNLTLHFRARSLAGDTPGPWVYDTRLGGGVPALPASGSGSGSSEPAHSSNGGSETAAAAAGACAPLRADTGCGELPEGLELVLKLMVPGELASAVCAAAYAYEGRSDAPPGISASDPVEFEALLVGFEREGYWQHLGWGERWALAERLKAKGNELFRAKKYKFAANRYAHLLRLLESTRDFDEQEQVDRADGLKASLLSNLALAAFHQEDYARCLEWCDKALQMDPGAAKVVFTKGKALSMKGDHEEAEEHLAAAAELDPSFAADAAAARAANKQRAKAASAKQKQQFRNFFSKKA